MDEQLKDECIYYGEKLEEYFHDMVDFEFTIEKGKLFVLNARRGRRTKIANIKIVLSLFCEGKISVEDVFRKIPYQQIVELIDERELINADELCLLGQGVPASGGVETARVCWSSCKINTFINKRIPYILFINELQPGMEEEIQSKYCKGIIAARGGMTSHAAVFCRGIRRTCVTGINSSGMIESVFNEEGSYVTIDGNTGKVYLGMGIIKNNNYELEEIKGLYVLLDTVIKNNIITEDIIPLIWRLWDVIVLHKHYGGVDNSKRIVKKKGDKYISFKPPTKGEIDNIQSNLKFADNADIMIEDFLGFLVEQLSAKVSTGCHYLYMRPLLDPMDLIKIDERHSDDRLRYVQLTGVEFFYVNRYIDFLIDIYSIKIFFSTEVIVDKNNMSVRPDEYFNYLDYTNPSGEGLIINNYQAKGILVVINDTIIPIDKLMYIYHLIRRRRYYWTWYRDNNIARKEITDYLRKKRYYNENHSKLYYLCEEMGLIFKGALTVAGESLIGMEAKMDMDNIEYILDELELRGYDEKPSDCNDYKMLLRQYEYKELITTELYEYYFWRERHEFDFQLLGELVEKVVNYLSSPAVQQQIEQGILNNLPTLIIGSIAANIAYRIKRIKDNNGAQRDEQSSWYKIKENSEKIDKAFSECDYILTEEIENKFETNREEIQPLLKLIGCKCFIDKKRSVWIKPGVGESRIREILKNLNFKIRR